MRDPGTGEIIYDDDVPRWVGTGRTIFNNKGNPVKQYEPYFSSVPAYDSEADLVEWGVTPIIRYDSIDRVVRTDLPDGTFTKVVFDSWEQETWDQNDTCRHPTDPSQHSGWYVERGAPSPLAAEPTDPETRAAWLSAQHADTPTRMLLDSLGRPFLSVAHNRMGTGAGAVDEFYRTRTELDIEGNTLKIFDAKQHSKAEGNHALNPSGTYPTITQTFDVLGRRLVVDSPDAGKRLSIQDVAGKPLRAYNSRGFTSRSEFDAAQRPTHAWVKPSSADDLLVARMSYGEALDPAGPPPTSGTPSSAQALNLRGRVHLAFDTAGMVKTDEVDFKGNVLSASRRITDGYKPLPHPTVSGATLPTNVDWNVLATITDPGILESTAAPLLALEPGTSNVEVFTTVTVYDALNRVVQSTTPDGSITTPSYNEANLLEESSVTLPASSGGGTTRVVFGLDYNARGQRLRANHNDTGSDASSHSLFYSYDPATFRVTEIRTERAAGGAGNRLQHLRYTYDAVGNIVEKRDDADWDPDLMSALDGGNARYTYDALYRLVRATGREHAGQQAMDPTSSFNGEPPKGSVPHGNDLSGMRDYVEETTYDEVGNITRMRHLTGVSNSESWSRDYAYFPGTNRLEGTSAPGGLPGNTNAKYEYSTSADNNAGLHGSMTKMPHLDEMHWDFADRLQHVVKQTGGNQQSYYVYDGSGQRVRKVYEHGQIDERIYLGGVEIYRKRASSISDPVEVERATLHVNDDTRRVAMVETKTLDINNEEPNSPLNQGRWRYQLDNHLGSSAMEIDGSASANVISYEEYHLYGSTAFHLWSSSAEVSAKRYRYTGKEKDEETGLYYHGARYYAPWLGRWTAADPAGLVDGLNLYRYSRDNPINFSDPSGTESQGQSARRNLGQYNFTGNETRAELESLANEQGYTIVGTPTWNAERKGWELGQIQRLPSESSESITFEDDYITASPPAESTAEPPPPTADAPSPPAGDGESIRSDSSRRRSPRQGSASTDKFRVRVAERTTSFLWS